MSRICSNCHNPILDSVKFCKKCGTAAPVQALSPKNCFCSKCGTALTPQARFCKTCGTAVETKPISEVAITPKTAPVQMVTPSPPYPTLTATDAPSPAVAKTPRKLGFKAIAILLAVVIGVSAFFISPAFGFFQMKARASAAEKIYEKGATVEQNVSVNKSVKLGSLGKTGWTADIEKGTFSSDTELNMEILSYVETADYLVNGGKIVGSVLEITAEADGQDIIYLRNPAVISMQIPSSENYNKDNMDSYVAACLHNNEWITVAPLAVDLNKGIVTFETDHFTSYAVLSLDEQAQISKLAADYAKREWSKGNAKEQVMSRLKTSLVDALTASGIDDKAMQDKIILNIKKSSKFDSFVTDIENGKKVDVGKTCSEMTADAIMSQYVDFPGSSMVPIVGVVSSLAKGTAELERGNYKNATVHYAQAIAKAFPPTKMLNSAIEGVQFYGILSRDWDRFSESIAYRVYCEYIGGMGNSYKIDSPEWKRVVTEMYGTAGNLEQAALEQHSKQTGISISDLKKDAAQVHTIVTDYNKSLKDRYTERYVLERDLEKRQAEYVKIVQGMMKDGLLNRGSLVYDYDMDVRDRLDQLFVMRSYILDLFGGKMPILKIGESHDGNMNDAISYLLICRGDTAEFFKWLEEKGYITARKPAESTSSQKSDSDTSFTAVYKNNENVYNPDRFENGLILMFKQNGSLSFDVGSDGGVSVAIPTAEFEKPSTDYDVMLTKYHFYGCTLTSAGKQDTDGIWELKPGTFTMGATLIDTNSGNPEDNTLNVEYLCNYEGSIRVWGGNNVQILLRFDYTTTVNSIQNPEKASNRVIIHFTK